MENNFFNKNNQSISELTKDITDNRKNDTIIKGEVKLNVNEYNKLKNHSLERDELINYTFNKGQTLVFMYNTIFGKIYIQKYKVFTNDELIKRLSDDLSKSTEEAAKCNNIIIQKLDYIKDLKETIDTLKENLATKNDRLSSYETTIRNQEHKLKSINKNVLLRFLIKLFVK